LSNGRDELFRENVHRAPNGFQGAASMMEERSVSVPAGLGTTLSGQREPAHRLRPETLLKMGGAYSEVTAHEIARTVFVLGGQRDGRIV